MHGSAERAKTVQDAIQRIFQAMPLGNALSPGLPYQSNQNGPCPANISAISASIPERRPALSKQSAEIKEKKQQ
jgi:hypothetical protein